MPCKVGLRDDGAAGRANSKDKGVRGGGCGSCCESRNGRGRGNLPDA